MGWGVLFNSNRGVVINRGYRERFCYLPCVIRYVNPPGFSCALCDSHFRWCIDVLALGISPRVGYGEGGRQVVVNV